MSYVIIFNLFSLLLYLIPLGIVVACVFLMPKKFNFFHRAVTGVAFSWFFLVVFTMYLYNPVGIRMGYEIGMDSPEMKFDNNTVASMVLGGWLIPTLAAVILFFVIKTVNKR